jgi:hypothetical protein
MRWQQLFADLAAQFAHAEAAEELAESASRARSELGAVTLVDRLGGSVGSPLRVRCRGAGQVAGVLADLGPGWLLLVDERGAECLVAAGAVTSVTGLGRRTSADVEEDGRPRVRFDLRLLLRAMARDRSAVSVTTDDGVVLIGTVDRVGADFVELAEHPMGEPRRASAVRAVHAIALDAVALVARTAEAASG